MPEKNKESRHRFDLVAYDQYDAPFLLIETNAKTNQAARKRTLRDLFAYAEALSRHSPLLMLADPKHITLFRLLKHNEWKSEHTFNTGEILRRYDPGFDARNIFEEYLSSLLQVWLNDIAYNLGDEPAPGKDVFEKLDLIEPLRAGSRSVEDLT